MYLARHAYRTSQCLEIYTFVHNSVNTMVFPRCFEFEKNSEVPITWGEDNKEITRCWTHDLLFFESYKWEGSNSQKLWRTPSSFACPYVMNELLLPCITSCWETTFPDSLSCTHRPKCRWASTTWRAFWCGKDIVLSRAEVLERRPGSPTPNNLWEEIGRVRLFDSIPDK